MHFAGSLPAPACVHCSQRFPLRNTVQLNCHISQISLKVMLLDASRLSRKEVKSRRCSCPKYTPTSSVGVLSGHSIVGLGREGIRNAKPEPKSSLFPSCAIPNGHCTVLSNGPTCKPARSSACSSHNLEPHIECGLRCEHVRCFPACLGAAQW